MTDHFDPYHVWLGIPPEEQPPNHYRLLGLRLFESSQEVIDHAADQRMSHLRTFQAGQNGHLSQRLLNEVSAARLCLLNAEMKASYDDQLRLWFTQPSVPYEPLPPLPNSTVPVAVGFPLSAATVHSLPSSLPRSARQPLLIIGGFAVAASLGVVTVLFVLGQNQRGGVVVQRSVEPAPFPPVIPSAPKAHSSNDLDAAPEPPPAPTPPTPQGPLREDPPKPQEPPPEPRATPPTSILPDTVAAKPSPLADTANDRSLPSTENKEPVTNRSFVVDLSLPLALPGAIAPAAEKHAIPEPEPLAQGRLRVQDIFKADLASAKAAAQKVALATRLIENAAGTDDAVDRFALLLEAGELAAKAGEVSVALKAVDDMAVHFELEPITAKGRLLGLAAKVNSPSVARNVAESALQLADESLALERPEVVVGFTRIALEASRKARDARFANEVKKRETDLRQLSSKLPTVQEARATLDGTPEDAAANEIVGRWLCLDLDEWDAGLPYLAKSRDVTWQKLAYQELQDPDSVKQQLELADGWWEAATAENAAVKAKLQAHAATWYRAAQGKLTGLDKVRVEKRLEGLPGAHRPVASSTPRTPARPPKVRFLPVCSLLQAKRSPNDLVASALSFQAPDGDGRRGANGFFLAAESWTERGTAWTCDFRRAGTARGIHFFHPFRNGHVLVTAGASTLHLTSIERWGDRTYTPNDPGISLQKAKDFGATYYLTETPRKLLSYLGPQGDFRFFVDGKLVATAVVTEAQPFLGASDFKATALPGILPAGMAGILIGPTDSDPNLAVDIAFGAIAPRVSVSRRSP